MAVPTRTEALSLLMSTAPAPRLLQHMTVVAEVAAFLAFRAGRAGVAVDRRLVEAAALLHDIDKALPYEHPLKALGHGEAGAAWLSEAGHPELARAIIAHPVTRFTAPGAEAWAAGAPIEERIVTYADKRATQRVVSLEQRFDRWRTRHPEYAAKLDRAYAVAQQLESGLCATIGIEPTQVERLRWVDDAMARAAAAGAIETPIEPDRPFPAATSSPDPSAV
jgi:putative nucleotidyltransferase with HDIG domain